jgi:hypothetical protein
MERPEGEDNRDDSPSAVPVEHEWRQSRLAWQIQPLYRPQMVTEEDIRRVCLSLPGGVEKPYNRLPSFRVGRNLFVRIHELPDTFFVRCGSLPERNVLIEAEPDAFFITPHYEGYPGVLVRLSRVDLEHMTELVIESWRLCAPKRMLAAFDDEHPPVA